MKQWSGGISKRINKKWLMVIGGICVCFLMYDFISGSADAPANAPIIELMPQEQIAVISSAPVSTTAVVPESAGSSATEVDVNTIDASNFYVAYRMEREQARSRQMELLEKIINNGNSTAAAKQQAQAEYLAIVGHMNQEMQLENLLKAKDFADAAAFIQAGKATVVVKGELNNESAAKIADLVKSTTGLSMENVVVMQKN